MTFGADVPELAPDKQKSYGTASPSTSQPRPGNSTLLTSGLLISNVMGLGLYSVGTSVGKLGWLGGAMAMVLLMAMGVHMSTLTWRVYLAFPSATTYGELASAAFSRAPPWQRRLAEGLVTASQRLGLLVAIAVCTLNAGRGLGIVFHGEMRLCLPKLVLVVIAVFLPWQFAARRLGYFRYMLALNIVAIMGSVVLPLACMSIHGVSGRPPGSDMQAFGGSSLIGVLAGMEGISFCMASQSMFVEVLAEMRDPADFPLACTLSTIFQGCIYMVAGIGAYHYMGSAVQGILIENLPFGPTLRLAAICFMVHMLTSYLSRGMVLCQQVHTIWFPSDVSDDSLRGMAGWSTTVVACMAAAWVIGQLVPSFEEITELMGATLVPLSAFILPAAMYARWLYDSWPTGRTAGPKPRALLEPALVAAEVSLALVYLTLGSGGAVASVGRGWGVAGLPFECHCDGIWSTCGCSPTHAGMEFCA